MADKKILVLCASARKNGNSEMLADAFIAGAEDAGNIVKKVNVADLAIGGCKGCGACWKTQGNCVFNDDMKKIEPLLEAADVLVIASPLYWSVVPAQMKAPIDRTYQYDPNNGGKHLHIKESVLLSCGETDQDADFDMMRSFFRFFTEFNGMSVKDMICVTGVNEKGAIKGNPALEKAKALGASF
jgi:multimeric flavodoxin WrbA